VVRGTCPEGQFQTRVPLPDRQHGDVDADFEQGVDELCGRRLGRANGVTIHRPGPVEDDETGVVLHRPGLATREHALCASVGRDQTPPVESTGPVAARIPRPAFPSELCRQVSRQFL
jgi:hypothetical protein